IGGHAQKVAALSPENVAPQLVHDPASCTELNGERRRCIKHDALDGIRSGGSRVAGKLDVAETVESEVRFERFTALPAQDISIGGLGRAQVLGVEIAIRLEHLAEADSNFSPSLTRNMQAR